MGLEGLCSRCQHRETCYRLCSEAEAYVNQDNNRPRRPGKRDAAEVDSLSDGDVLTASDVAEAERRIFVRPLSNREHQVVTHLASGKKKNQVAQAMGITRNTLKTYLKRIKKKTI